MDKKKSFIHPYIPNAVPEVKEEMLREIGVNDIDELYDDIPEELRLRRMLNLPQPLLSELDLKRHLEKILDKNKSGEEYISFLGGGCAHHYINFLSFQIDLFLFP